MSEYKVIFRTSREKPDKEFPLTWERGCPLMLEAIQISRNTGNGKAFLQARLRNVCAEEVSLFKAKFVCRFKEEALQEFVIEPLDADIASGAEYVVKPIELPYGDAIGVEGAVLFVSGASETWESSIEPEMLPGSKRLGLSEDAIDERTKELREVGCSKFAAAASYALEGHEHWVLCPCGQVNVGTDRCVSCGLSFGAYRSGSEDEEELERRAMERQKREEAEKQAQEDRKNARRKKMIRVCAPILVIGIILASFWYFTVSLPRTNAENEFSEFQSGNTLYEYEEWVDFDEWNEKSSSYQDGLKGLIDSAYFELSDESKLKVLEQLAKAQTIDEIYKKNQSNWAVNPSELRISVALEKVTVEDDVDKNDTFTVCVESRDQASWYSRSLKRNTWTTFKHKYEAKFTANVIDGTIDMWPLICTSTDLVGYY